MVDPRHYRRPPLPHRTWIRGGLYDLLSRSTVLHCDAYVREHDNGLKYLEIDWRAGGSKQVAHDLYFIEPDGLTPAWPNGFMLGRALQWGTYGDPWWPALHKRVVMIAQEAEASGAWARVSLLCHYVHAPDTDCEISAERNKYVERKPYAPRRGKLTTGTLPDLL